MIGRTSDANDLEIPSGDRACYKKYDIGRIILEKLAYNETRLDHKLEVRNAPGGKAV